MTTVITQAPRPAAAAQAGLQLVAAINSGDPTRGAVPFRNTGDVAALMARFSDAHLPHFHRYASVILVGSFDTREHAQAAQAMAEHAMRLNPAPDVQLNCELGSKRKTEQVNVFGRYLGHISTHWDDESRSIINETQPDHEFRDGFVVRQIALVGSNSYATTFGEGVNIGWWHAWANGTFGLSGFSSMNDALFRSMKGQPGFLDSELSIPRGAISGYPLPPYIGP